VLLRASYATAFKPPTLYNLYALPSGAALPVTDPRRSGESVIVSSNTGGNPGLQPTTSHSSTAGIAWTPAAVKGLGATISWWSLVIDNAITLPNAQFIIDNEPSYPGRVARAPSTANAVGPITAVDRTYINFGEMRERGWDGSIDYSFDTAVGRFAPSAAATYMTKFRGASAPGLAPVDRLSRANSDGIFAPRMKATASLAWEPAPTVKAWIAGRYVGRYHDYAPLVTHTLGDFWYLDASLDISLESAFRQPKGSMGGLRLIVSATNLADKSPTWSTHFRGYDIYNYDLIGRTVFVRLQMRTT
jgi:outer membrane receptor protein involved in Fe transport